MPAARQLVQERKYSEAIKILAQVVKNEPERLDEVEAMMAEIRSARNLYNRNYSQLIQLLKKENLTDQDISDAYNLISEMEKLDADPDQAIIGSFDRARRTIVFRYNDMQFREIMDAALALITEKRYWEALALYESAVGIHSDIFAEDYPAETVSETNEEAAALRSLIASATAVRQDFDNAAARAVSESMQTPSGSPRKSEYEELLSAVGGMALIRERAAVHSRDFEARKNTLLEEGEYDIPYLTAMSRVVTGRASAQSDEGILAVIDYIRDGAIEANTAYLAAKFSENFEKGKQEFEQQLYLQSERSFLLASRFAETEIEVRSLAGFSLSPSGGAAVDDKTLRKIYTYMPQYIEAVKNAAAGSDYAALSQIMQRTSSIDAAYRAEASFETLMSYRSQVLQDNTIISIGKAAWEENVSSLTGMAAAGLPVQKPLELSREMRDLYGKHENDLSSLAVSVLRKGVDLAYNPLADNLLNHKEDAGEGFEMVDGAYRTMGTGEAEYTALVKYPAQALDLFRQLNAEMNGTETGFRQLIGVIAGRGGSDASHPLLKERNDQALAGISDIESLRARIRVYTQNANELLTQAEIFRNQGTRYMGEARLNLQRQNFDLARERLQLARESFLNSLSFNEDRQLRDSTDREIQQISEDILRLQTVAVVEAVRKNLVQARDFYIRERFGDAENLLINSQTLWRTVNSEDNTEINYWLNLVQTALSVRSGRVIAETDPLYNEMTQVLNLARNDYLNAVAANERRATAEMMRHLEAAEEKLLYVTIPFPMNQEASVLSLKILMLKDRDNFNALFRERFNLARQRININPAETYTILKDLQAINPDYPGMNQAIYDTEIRLGMRTPPPDPAKIREAETLYERAFAIVRTNVRSNYPTALAYLERAFELNPDDSRITTLKDRVQAEMGGTTTVVLSSYAQQQYRLAEQEFINGNYYASLAIVERLLQDSRNRNYSPLLELKRRIDSKI